MRAWSPSCSDHQIINPSLQVLRFELRRQPELLGMSVFGYNEVYSVYQPFVKRWRACRGGGGGEAQVWLSLARIRHLLASMNANFTLD